MLVPHFKYCMRLLLVPLNRESKRFQEGKKDLCLHTWNAQTHGMLLYAKKCEFGSCYDRTYRIFSGNILHKD